MPALPNISAAESRISLNEACNALGQAAHRVPLDSEAFRSILTAARLVWAILYGEILVSGEIRDPQLRAFDALLCQAIGQIQEVKPDSQPGISAPATLERLIFYRKLLGLLDTGGLQRVAEEIQGQSGEGPVSPIAASQPGTSAGASEHR